MEYRKCGHTFILRLDSGDEIISSLTALAENENIRTARVQGLGASNHAKIALYDLEKKEFHRKTLDVPMEIASLNGNISRKDGKPYLHVHIGLATPDLSLFGGHLVECVISVTAEIFVDVLDCETRRTSHSSAGIWSSASSP